MENPLPNIEPHRHTGVDSLRILEQDIEGAVDQNNVVLKTTDQTIAGVKTFSSIPVLPASDPTTDNQAARKAYVDSLMFSSFVIEPSANIKDSADTERTETNVTEHKVKEIEYNEINGTITVDYDLKDAGSGAAISNIYINGIAAGTQRNSTGTYVTYSENIPVETDDLIQIYVSVDAGRTIYIRNFRLKYSKSIAATAGTVVLD